MSTSRESMGTQVTANTLHRGPEDEGEEQPSTVGGFEEQPSPEGELEEQPPWADLVQRLQKAERQTRRLKYAVLIMIPLLIYVFVDRELPHQLVQREPLVAADRLQLFDEAGNTRMSLRMYSGVPVVQLIDENGTPRLSLGLRYDDSPFISLSDVHGQTRASLQVGADYQPALTLFDEHGEASFSAN